MPRNTYACLFSALRLPMLCLAVAAPLADAAQAAEQSDPATTTEKAKDYVETAKPTPDGEVHPGGKEPEPRESWFTPCPPDKKVEKSGDCTPADSASENTAR